MVVAFFSAIFTALQWKSSERSADAAERSAEAAEESAESTKVLTQTGQRAWVALQTNEVARTQSGDDRGLKYKHPWPDAESRAYASDRCAPQKLNSSLGRSPYQVTLNASDRRRIRWRKTFC